MKPLESLQANKWYPHYNGPGRSYKSSYPTPQSILRKAVGVEEYKFVSETVTTEHIRAAAVMPLDVPFQHLLESVPWGMTYTTKEWRMLIVSVLDPVKWLTMARMSGAIGWLKGHNQTITYNWEPPEVDEHGLKKRPPNALGITGEPVRHANGRKVRTDSGSIKKSYNKEALLADVRLGLMTHTEIGQKHGISRITVFNIARRHGLTKPGKYVKTST